MLGLSTFFGLAFLLTMGTWFRPAVGFAAVLCLYGLKQWGQDTSMFLVEHRTIANFVAAGLVAVGLVRQRMLAAAGDRDSLSLPWVLCVVLYGYAFVTLAWTPDLKSALEQWTLQGPYILMIALLAPLLLRHDEDLLQVSHWMLLVGGAICVLALFFGHWGSRGLLFLGNVEDQEANPLAIASLAGTVTVIAVLSFPSASWSKRLLCVGLAPIGLVTILRSGSRGQLIATAIAVVIGSLLAAPRKKLGPLLMLACILGGLVAVGSWAFSYMDVTGVDVDRWTGHRSEEDLQGRLSSATDLLQVAIGSPTALLFGLGNSSAIHYVGYYPHVAPAEVLAEEGLLGMTVYLGILGSAALGIYRLKGQLEHNPDPRAHYACGLLAALLVFELVLTAKEGSLLSSTYVMAYAAAIGRLVKWDRTSAQSEAAPGAVPALPFPNILR